MVEFLCIVSRERRELYEYLRGRFASEPLIRVVLDRRQGERRQREGRASTERRVIKRRRRDVADDLRYLGWSVIRATELRPRAAHQAGATPTLRIEGLTATARALLEGRAGTVIRLPFTIVRGTAGGGGALDLLAIPDRPPFRVSRRHCTIFVRSAGAIAVIDHGSHLGTVVNGVLLGGESATRHAALREGPNEIGVGGWQTPYRFNVVVGGDSGAPVRPGRLAATKS